MGIYLAAYAALGVFLIVVIARVVRITSLPVHLRWELYPVAHEENAAHGGSFFERVDWWKHPRKHSLLGTLKVMVPEILFLKGVYEHNRSLWVRSYPFHLGLYLLAGFLGLLVVGGLLQTTGEQLSPAQGFGALIYWLTIVFGAAGLVLALIGALALLLRRLGDPALRCHSSAADFFNLVFFLVTAAVALLAFVVVDGDFAHLRGFVQQLATFDTTASLPPLVTVEVLLAAALLAYIPATHMSHFFTKWFMYHDVRWDDRVNEVGSELEGQIKVQLAYQVSWSASHINGGGKKTWVDVATEEVSKQ
ncbi:MAG: respiratory nitrate reductase subunit gamma [Pseudomonadota bacterium]